MRSSTVQPRDNRYAVPSSHVPHFLSRGSRYAAHGIANRATIETTSRETLSPLRGLAADRVAYAALAGLRLIAMHMQRSRTRPGLHAAVHCMDSGSLGALRRGFQLLQLLDSGGEVRVQLQRLFVVLNRKVLVAVLPVGVAKAVVGIGNISTLSLKISIASHVRCTIRRCTPAYQPGST